MGFLKKLGKNLLVGLKYAGKNVEVIGPFIGVPPIAIIALKRAMGIVEARGGKAKAKEAVLLAMLVLQSKGVNIPTHKANLVIELLRDPDIQEGLWNFNLAKAEHEAQLAGVKRGATKAEMITAMTEALP